MLNHSNILAFISWSYKKQIHTTPPFKIPILIWIFTTSSFKNLLSAH